jgi:hypothetical protein
MFLHPQATHIPPSTISTCSSTRKGTFVRQSNVAAQPSPFTLPPHNITPANHLSPHNITPATHLSPHNITPATHLSPHNITPATHLPPHNITPATHLSPHNITTATATHLEQHTEKIPVQIVQKVYHRI